MFLNIFVAFLVGVVVFGISSASLWNMHRSLASILEGSTLRTVEFYGYMLMVLFTVAASLGLVALYLYTLDLVFTVG